MKLNRLTITVLCAVLAVLFGFDIWTLAVRGYDTTVSWQLWIWSHDWPIIPFTFGVFAGHLFFPNRASFKAATKEVPCDP